MALMCADCWMSQGRETDATHVITSGPDRGMVLCEKHATIQDKHSAAPCEPLTERSTV